MKVPVVALPVYFSVPVRLATPLLKLAAWLRTLLYPGAEAGDGPAERRVGDDVTLSVEALKVVTVLPKQSCAVSVFVPVKAAPLVWGPARTKANFARAAGADGDGEAVGAGGGDRAVGGDDDGGLGLVEVHRARVARSRSRRRW